MGLDLQSPDTLDEQSQPHSLFVVGEQMNEAQPQSPEESSHPKLQHQEQKVGNGSPFPPPPPPPSLECHEDTLKARLGEGGGEGGDGEAGENQKRQSTEIKTVVLHLTDADEEEEEEEFLV